MTKIKQTADDIVDTLKYNWINRLISTRQTCGKRKDKRNKDMKIGETLVKSRWSQRNVADVRKRTQGEIICKTYWRNRSRNLFTLLGKREKEREGERERQREREGKGRPKTYKQWEGEENMDVEKERESIKQTDKQTNLQRQETDKKRGRKKWINRQTQRHRQIDIDEQRQWMKEEEKQKWKPKWKVSILNYHKYVALQLSGIKI